MADGSLMIAFSSRRRPKVTARAQGGVAFLASQLPAVYHPKVRVITWANVGNEAGDEQGWSQRGSEAFVLYGVRSTESKCQLGLRTLPCLLCHPVEPARRKLLLVLCQGGDVAS